MKDGDLIHWLVELAAEIKAGDWISLVVALATVVMAGATYYLAKVTGRLARETANATKQADRHHQENRRPFCVMTFYEANKQRPFGIEFNPESRRLSELTSEVAGVIGRQPLIPVIFIHGKLENKGTGPAKDVLVYLNARLGEGEDDVFRLTRPVLMSGLVAAGEMVAIDVQITERDIMRLWDGKKWNPTQVFHAIPEQTYEVVLEYRDIFDNLFRTVHPRGIWAPPVPDMGDPAVRTQIMIRPDRPSPIFLTGTQALRTLADAPGLLPNSAPPDDCQ